MCSRATYDIPPPLFTLLYSEATAKQHSFMQSTLTTSLTSSPTLSKKSHPNALQHASANMHMPTT
eukprot:scaffold8341_cov57-Attheya_sp.AAC.1